ncbi:MAG TPA: pentapeptide repeat-containing protein [Candidatus Rifleibacterium sp.]|nr:pentapeptide repeat-containing protein [Candidatus Rifleibacterium sp.]HPT46075.1 pentapeptide repeat-containing protein [Candidatus Rifleibacterium sp.]
MKHKKQPDAFSNVFDGYLNLLLRFIWNPLQRLAGDPGKASGPILLLFALRRLLVVAILFAAFGLFVAAMSHFKIGTENFLGEIFGYLIGFPVMLGLIYVCLDFLRLVILAASNRRGDEELTGALRTLVLGLGVVMFFSGLLGMVNLQMWFSSKATERAERAKLQQEQQEYLSYLKRGRQAWNAYINRTSMHYIEFSGMNLDGFDFSGYDLNMVKFKNTSLKGARFDDCYLPNANFDRADCQGASFKKSYCMMTSFFKTSLQNADFTGAFIRRATLAKADCQNATLTDLNENFNLSPWNSR